MSQYRSFTYQSPVDAFSDNWHVFGLLEPGRYKGFETLTKIATLQFELSHTGGIVKTLENLTQTPARSVVLTPQGMVIEEDDVITLSTTSNAANAYQRIDLVIMEHEFLSVVGGQAATYSVITGPSGSPLTLPSLPNPEKQVIIGKLIMPASAADIDDAVWVPVIPENGFASLADSANFKKAVGSGVGGNAVYDASSQILGIGDVNYATVGDLGGDKNIAGLYKSADPISTLPNGALVSITSNVNNLTFKQFPTGMFINPTGADIILPANSTITYRIVGDGVGAILVCISDDVNNITTLRSDVDDLQAIPHLPLGGIAMWTGVIGSNFDGTGLGSSAALTGWALCNGNNGTVDLSGKFIVGYDNSDPDYNTLGNTGGEKEHQLTIGELPAHTHATDVRDSAGGVSNVYSAGTNSTVTDSATGSTGSDLPHENRPPYYVLAFIQRIS